MHFSARNAHESLFSTDSATFVLTFSSRFAKFAAMADLKDARPASRTERHVAQRTESLGALPCEVTLRLWNPKTNTCEIR